MKIQKALLSALTILIVSCGKGGGGSSGSSSVANPACVEKLNLFSETPSQTNEVIIDDLRWKSTDALDAGSAKSNAGATALIKLPSKRSRCTGFLINDDMLMTNHHCVADQGDAKGAYATFGYTASSGGKKYTCDEFIASNSALDVGILKCSGSPGKTLPKVVLADYKAQVNDLIYITHQNCDYTRSPGCKPTQKYSEGLLLGSGSSNVEHNADTLGGSSGSPIFDKKSHKVIALHNAGQSYGGGGGMNFGVPMYRIVEFLKREHPEVELQASTDRAPAYQTCE